MLVHQVLTTAATEDRTPLAVLEVFGARPGYQPLPVVRRDAAAFPVVGQPGPRQRQFGRLLVLAAANPLALLPWPSSSNNGARC